MITWNTLGAFGAMSAHVPVPVPTMAAELSPAVLSPFMLTETLIALVAGQEVTTTHWNDCPMATLPTWLTGTTAPLMVSVAEAEQLTVEPLD